MGGEDVRGSLALAENSPPIDGNVNEGGRGETRPSFPYLPRDDCKLREWPDSPTNGRVSRTR